MRLTPAERTKIKKIVRESAPGAAVYLFGSRVRDDLRGGDIDLLIVGKGYDPSLLRTIKIELKDALGDQRIDILWEDADASTPFGQIAMESAEPL